MAKEKAPFDFSGLTVTEAEMPAGTGAGRKRKYETNPFIEPLAESYEAFQKNGSAGRKVTVPGSYAGEVLYLVRKAAEELGCGSSVYIQRANGTTVTAKEAKTIRGNVTVLFSAKKRRKTKSDDEASTETEAPEAEETEEETEEYTEEETE